MTELKGDKTNFKNMTHVFWIINFLTIYEFFVVLKNNERFTSSDWVYCLCVLHIL